MNEDEKAEQEERRFADMLSAAKAGAPEPDWAFLQRVKEQSTQAFLAEAKPEPVSRRKTMMTSLKWLTPSAVAASVVIVLVWSFLGTPQSTLFARVSASMSRADTVHMTEERRVDGTWQIRKQWWAQADGRVAEKSLRGGVWEWRVSDKQHEYRHREGDAVGVRITLERPVGWVRQLLDGTIWNRKAEKFKRVRGEPELLEGIPCKRYRRNSTNGHSRETVWIGDDDRVYLGMSERRTGAGSWEPERRTTVRYDVPIDGRKLSADFGPHVRVIDFADYLEQHYMTAVPVAVRKVEPVQLTVHNVAMVEDGLVFIEASLDLTEGASAELQRDGNLFDAGTFTVHGYDDNEANVYRQPDYDAWTIGKTEIGSRVVQWVLLRPTRPPQPGHVIDLFAEIRLNGGVAYTLLPDASKRKHQFAPAVSFRIPDADAATTLRQLTHKLYGQAHILELAGYIPAMFTAIDHGSIGLNAPNRFTAEQYHVSVARLLEWRHGELGWTAPNELNQD